MLLEIGALLSSIVGGVLLLKNSSAKKEEELNNQIATMQTEHEQELEQKEEEKQQAVDEAVSEEKQRQDEVFEQKEQDKADEQRSVDPRSGSLYFGDKSLTEDGKAFAVDYDPFYDYTDNDLGLDAEDLATTSGSFYTAAHAMRCRFVSPYMLVSELRNTNDGMPKIYMHVIGDLLNNKYCGLSPFVTNESGTARRALFGAWREFGFMLEVFNPYEDKMPLTKIVLSKIKIGGQTVNVLGGNLVGDFHTATETHKRWSSAIYQFGSSQGFAFETGDNIGFGDPNGRSGYFYKLKGDMPELEYEVSFGSEVWIDGKSSKLFFIQIPLSRVETGCVLLKDFSRFSSPKSSAAECLCTCNDINFNWLYTSNPNKFDLEQANTLYDQNLANMPSLPKSKKSYRNKGNFGRCATLLLSLFDWGAKDGQGVTGYIVNEMFDPGMPNEKTMEFNVTLVSSDDSYKSAGRIKRVDGGWGGGFADQYDSTAKCQAVQGATSTHPLKISCSAELSKKQGTDYKSGFVTPNVCSIAFGKDWDNGSTGFDPVHYIEHGSVGASNAVEILSEISSICGDEELDYQIYDDCNIE